MGWVVLGAVMIACDDLMLMCFCAQFLRPRPMGRGGRSCCFAALIILQLAKNLLPWHQLLPILNAGLMLAAMAVLFRGKWWRKLLLVTVIFGAMFLGEVLLLGLTAVILPGADIFESEAAAYIMGAASRMAVPLLLLALRRVMRGQLLAGHPAISGIRGLLIAPAPLLICAVVLVYSPFAALEREAPGLFWICMAGLTLAFAYMAAMVVWMLRTRLARQRLSQAEAATKLMQAQAEGMAQERQRVQTTLHDMRHHLAYLSQLADAPEYEQAVGDQLRTGGITGNVVVDAIFQAKRATLPGEVRLNVNGTLPASLPWLEPPDIVALLGNTIDNAAQAVLAMGGGVVDVGFHYDGRSLALGVSNHYDGPAIPMGWAQTPRGGHGYGLPGMAAVAARYNGHLHYEGDGHTFEVLALLNRREEV